mgnify:CR=1 FL=1
MRGRAQEIEFVLRNPDVRANDRNGLMRRVPGLIYHQRFSFRSSGGVEKLMPLPLSNSL